jgi:hypothetical protein
MVDRDDPSLPDEAKGEIAEKNHPKCERRLNIESA